MYTQQFILVLSASLISCHWHTLFINFPCSENCANNLQFIFDKPSNLYWHNTYATEILNVLPKVHLMGTQDLYCIYNMVKETSQ